MIHRDRRFSFFRRVLFFLLVLGWSGMGEAQDIGGDWQADLEQETADAINAIIRGLDAPVRLRKENIEKLIKAAKQKEGATVHRLLIRGLENANAQIREGIIEVLAHIGNPKSVPALAFEMRFGQQLSSRILLARILPSFLLHAKPKLRAEYLASIFRDDFALTSRLRRFLQRPPLRESNQAYEAAEDSLRRTIEYALASQLDPIATIISGLTAPRSEHKAKLLLGRIAPDYQGRSQEETAEQWKINPVDAYVSPMQNDLIQVQIAAAQMLAAVGAQGTNRVREGLERIAGATRTPRLVAAGLVASAAIAALDYTRLRQQQEPLATKRKKITEEETVWRTQRIAGAKQSIQLARTLGLTHLQHADLSVRAAALRALAATRDTSVVPAIRQRYRSGKEPPLMQVRIARALGAIGGADAVRLLGDLAAYQSFTANPKVHKVEYQIVWTSAEALARIARRFDPIVGKQAVEVLLELLGKNERELSGGPRSRDNTAITVAMVALRHLQTVIGQRRENRDATIWRKAYADILFQHQKIADD